MGRRTYYQILGVTRTEGAQGVRSAFRELARRYHPDRAGPRGTPFFQQIVKAYEVLSDPGQRASYDQGLADAAGPMPSPVTPMSQPRPSAEPLVPEPLVPSSASLMRDFVARGPSVDDIFDRIRRNFSGEWQPKSRRLDTLDLQLELSLDEAVRGGSVVLGVPVFYPCSACHGSGRQGLYACHACSETGMVEEEQPVELRIPPAVRDGTTFVLPLQGLGIHNLQLRVQVRVRR